MKPISTQPEPDPDWFPMLRLMNHHGFDNVRQALRDLLQNQASARHLERCRTHIQNLDRSPVELAFLFRDVATDIGVIS